MVNERTHRVGPPAEGLHAGLTIPVLTTERLVMTALAERHLDDYATAQYHPDVARWYGGLPDPPHTRAQQEEETWRVMATLLGHWALRGYGQWALEDRRTGAFVGRAGLWNPHGWVGVEVGWLVVPDRQGEGLATEAGRAAVAWGFSTLDLDQIVSVTLPSNAASRRVMGKVGLRDTGEQVTLRGHDQVVTRITRQEHAELAERAART